MAEVAEVEVKGGRGGALASRCQGGGGDVGMWNTKMVIGCVGRWDQWDEGGDCGLWMDGWMFSPSPIAHL